MKRYILFLSLFFVAFTNQKLYADEVSKLPTLYLKQNSGNDFGDFKIFVGNFYPGQNIKLPKGEYCKILTLKEEKGPSIYLQNEGKIKENIILIVIPAIDCGQSSIVKFTAGEIENIKIPVIFGGNNCEFNFDVLESTENKILLYYKNFVLSP